MTHQLTVADVMTRDVVTVTDDHAVQDCGGGAGRARDHRGPGHRPVRLRRRRRVRDGSAPQGAVPADPAADVVAARLRRKAAALVAAELMTHPVVTVEGGCTLDEAARLMAARDITRLIVVDDDQLVGIVTRSDLLRAFLAADPEILARVRRDVIAHVLWDDPLAVEVAVTDGVCTLAGRSEHRSTVAIAERLTREVDGVVGVRNELTWLFDDTVPPTRTAGFQ